MTKRTCSVEDCERPVKARGWCASHYERWRIGTPFGPPLRPYGVRHCFVEGCERPHATRGLCELHYGRWRTDKSDLRAPVQERNGRSSRNGYALIWKPDHPLASKQGYVAEHRMVAYDAGLLIDLSHVVHHKDGNKKNNAVENLEVLTSSEHSRKHDRLGALERAKTHCPQGHPYDEKNIRWYQGRRYCKACEKARSLRRSHERRLVR